MMSVLSNFWFLAAATIIIIAVVALVTEAWRKVRQAEQDAELKREMLQRGLSVEEIERLLGAQSAAVSEEAAAEDIELLTGQLGKCSVGGAVLEEVLHTFQSASNPARRAITRALAGLIEAAEENEELPNEEQILAVVRGVARGSRAAMENALSNDNEPDLPREPIRKNGPPIDLEAFTGGEKRVG